ncbi:MAG TPA: hypothetical protein VF137_00740 [Candidatus Dormibacteraeota bacterium]
MRVTDEAKVLLAEIERPEGQVLRLEATSPDKLGLVMGPAQPEDEVIESGGRDLLHVTAAVSAMLGEAVVERVETPEGSRFAISPDEHRAEADGV